MKSQEESDREVSYKNGEFFLEVSHVPSTQLSYQRANVEQLTVITLAKHLVSLLNSVPRASLH